MPSKKPQYRRPRAVIAVTLKEHLNDLRSAEGHKPPNQRREIPSISELANDAGVNRATLYNIAGNYVQSVNLKVLAAVMLALRERGFPTEVKDLLKEFPVVDDESQWRQ